MTGAARQRGGPMTVRAMTVMTVVATWLAGAPDAGAQQLRFTTGHRDIAVPSYASFRFGPLYSGVTFSEQVGYRYIQSSENAVDLRTGVWRGELTDDGSDFPLISTLTVNNYLPISRHMDLDMRMWASYEYYPLGTQKDRFLFNLTDEQLQADLNCELRPTAATRVRLYDRPIYMTDFIDLRGISDQYGGDQYERFENTAGVDIDWLCRKNANVAASLNRLDVVPTGGTFEDQNRTTHEGSLAYEQEVTPRVVAGAKLSLNRADYSAAAQGRYQAVGGSLFAHVALTKSTQGSASAGYAVTDLTSGDERLPSVESGGFVGSLLIRSQLARRVAHSLSYSRAMARGFSSGIDVSDSISYAVQYSGDMLSTTVDSGFSTASTEGGTVSGYQDWHVAVTFLRPLTKDIDLSLSSAYDQRTAGTWVEGTGDEPDAELLNDYSTWINRLSASMDFWRDIKGEAYVQHARRVSDAEGVSYQNLITGVQFTYTYEF